MFGGGCGGVAFGISHGMAGVVSNVTACSFVVVVAGPNITVVVAVVLAGVERKQPLLSLSNRLAGAAVSLRRDDERHTRQAQTHPSRRCCWYVCSCVWYRCYYLLLLVVL